MPISGWCENPFNLQRDSVKWQGSTSPSDIPVVRVCMNSTFCLLRTHMVLAKGVFKRRAIKHLVLSHGGHKFGGFRTNYRFQIQYSGQWIVPMVATITKNENAITNGQKLRFPFWQEMLAGIDRPIRHGVALRDDASFCLLRTHMVLAKRVLRKATSILGFHIW